MLLNDVHPPPQKEAHGHDRDKTSASALIASRRDLLHRLKPRAMSACLGYSISSSARASNLRGRVRPSAFAVLTLMTSSNVIGRSTGRSAGFAPRRILSTKSAARPHMLGHFVP